MLMTKREISIALHKISARQKRKMSFSASLQGIKLPSSVENNSQGHVNFSEDFDEKAKAQMKKFKARKLVEAKIRMARAKKK